MLRFKPPAVHELKRRSVADGRMLPFPVVENRDLRECVSLDLGVSSVADAMHTLIFHAFEPALCRGVIPAVAFPAHQARHAIGLESVLNA